MVYKYMYVRVYLSKVCHFYKELTLLRAGAINDVNAAGQAFIS